MSSRLGHNRTRIAQMEGLSTPIRRTQIDHLGESRLFVFRNHYQLNRLGLLPMRVMQFSSHPTGLYPNRHHRARAAILLQQLMQWGQIVF